MKKRFFNNIENSVDESLSGFIHLYPGLQYFKSCRFITKSKNTCSFNVALLSGGGSGHEPFCAGYVGDGMLSGAVAGNIFASPPKTHILQAIKYLHKYHKNGILVIVPNYTGDCLNFGMAVEQAKSFGINVETFIVGEDLASDKNPITGKRGMCGLLFIYKIAGALASEGKSLKEIIATLNLVIDNMSTLGVSSKPCSLPGQPPLFNIADDQMELGVGVHGEAGIQKINSCSAKTIVEILLSKLLAHFNFKDSEAKIGILVNNLGTTTEIEMNIICKNVFEYLDNKKIEVKRMYSGSLMTSLDMAGFQISILNLYGDEKELLRLLDAKTDAPKWVGSRMSSSDRTEQEEYFHDDFNENIKSVINLSQDHILLFKKCFRELIKKIMENELKLNELDSGCGDGDCGTTLKHLAEGMQQILQTENFECPARIFRALSDIAETKMGGTSGALYNLYFSSLSKCFACPSMSDLHILWSESLQTGLDTIKKYTRARKGDRTMIDALEPAIEEFRRNIKSRDVKYCIKKAADAAFEGLEATKFMIARAGRASYVDKEKLIDVDAGAYGVTLCLKVIENCF